MIVEFGDVLMKRNILYIGEYKLPDKNAAAQRVLSIAKGLSTLGHTVTFLNYSNNVVYPEWKQYMNIPCYEVPERNICNKLTNIDDVIRIIQEREITDLVAYNYPAFALSKVIRYCKKKSIRCFADATEWYMPKGSPFFWLVKKIDTEWRMRILHKEMDGVLAISEFLYQYYRNSVKTVKIPPTVDISEKKWKLKGKKDSEAVRFVYAGNPSAQKERLDLIIEAFVRINKKRQIKLKIIGITKEQYEKFYGNSYIDSTIHFCGRMSHLETVNCIVEADWTIVIRENNKVVKAGFPTKVAESISCGTPVIANRFSNIEDYLHEGNSILCELDQLEEAIMTACDTRKSVDTGLFDYHNYLRELQELLN